MTPDLIADVVLHASRGNPRPVLTYAVPPTLRDVLAVGMLVWVPLRNDHLQGIVLRLYPAPPVAQRPEWTIREISELGDPEAQIPPAMLRTGEWMADYYRTGLWDALALFLPPGAGRDASTHLFATPAGRAVDLATLPEVERSMLYYLRSHGDTPEAVLEDVLRGRPGTLKRAMTALAARGLVGRGVDLPPGQARPRYEQTARVLIGADFDWARLEGRAPTQAAALRLLVDRAVKGSDAEQMVSAGGVPVGMLRTLAAKGLIDHGQRELLRNPLDGRAVERDMPPELTVTQATALEPIIGALERAKHTVFLLHGITGSGKTELYLRALARTLRLGKQAVVLVPEIALTAQLVRRFAARFGPTVVLLHSALSLGERYDTWRRLRRGDARIVVGSRSALFAPLPELGLVILDEEHDSSYKHDEGVRYNAREVALKLGAETGSAVVLGSATPALESYHAAQTGKYQLLELPERITLRGSGRGSQVLPLPPVTLVDMRVELHQGNHSMFSRALQAALRLTLERQQQALLFLNRRGLASFVLCRDCGYVVGCAHCSSPLVVHAGDRRGPLPADAVLRCHTCNYRELPPNQCPRCWSQRIRHFGAGTQRVVEEAQALFPRARILRWDRDVTTRKGAHEQLFGAIQRHEVDVIVGTQMIAKGFDLPLITLVGVVSADTGLNLPDFRAGERAFQLLAQVSGRAGRRDLPSQVIVQSYTPEHYALRAAANYDYSGFYREEIGFRMGADYPPFAQLARLICTNASARSAESAAYDLAHTIDQVIAERKLPAAVIGPAPAFLEKVRDRYRWHLLIRAPDVHPLLDALGPLPGWIVDVDPQSLL